MYHAVHKFLSFNAEQENLLNTDFASGHALLSDDVMRRLEELNNFVCFTITIYIFILMFQLDHEYQSWVEQICERYHELKMKLKDLTHKCGGDIQNEFFEDKFDPGLATTLIYPFCTLDFKHEKLLSNKYLYINYAKLLCFYLPYSFSYLVLNHCAWF